jgi:tRNA dimethylallyltransferase
MTSAAEPAAKRPRTGSGPPRVLVIAGPTGVGKSKLAEALCHSLEEGGEIISADSVQVYRSLNIGSAKPTVAEQEAIPHHLIDIADPSSAEGYTAGQFCRDAVAAITDVWSRGRVPVVVGGTMMYHQWLVHGQPDAPPSDPAIAAAIGTELAPYKDKGDWEGARGLLVSEGFGERAEKLSKNDWYRLARALEIARAARTRDPDSMSSESACCAAHETSFDSQCHSVRLVVTLCTVVVRW